jgi:hypothetical protein
MDVQNAFIGKKVQPTAEELSNALGPTATLWKQLLDWFSEEQHDTDQDWKSSSPRYGWTLLLLLKKRRIAYLSPCVGCFLVSFVLGDRAVAAARQSGLSKRALKLLDEAPRYAEGTGLRLIVKSQRDLPAIRKLAIVKLTH